MAMEQLPKPLSARYNAVKLYIEDLEGIERIFADAGKFAIESVDYKFSEFSELIEHYQGQRLTVLDVFCSILDKNYISLSLTPYHCVLSSRDSDNTSAGLFHRLDTILRRTSRKPTVLYSIRVINTVLICFGIFSVFYNFVVFLNLQPYASYVWSYTFIVAPVIAIIFAWSFWILYVRMYRRSVIIIRRRSQTQNFFLRNRDELLMRGIVAIVSATLGVILGAYISFRLTKK
jgi:hypothetical protein